MGSCRTKVGGLEGEVVGRKLERRSEGRRWSWDRVGRRWRRRRRNEGRRRRNLVEVDRARNESCRRSLDLLCDDGRWDLHLRGSRKGRNDLGRWIEEEGSWYRFERGLANEDETKRARRQPRPPEQRVRSLRRLTLEPRPLIHVILPVLRRPRPRRRFRRRPSVTGPYRRISSRVDRRSTFSPNQTKPTTPQQPISSSSLPCTTLRSKDSFKLTRSVPRPTSQITQLAIVVHLGRSRRHRPRCHLVEADPRQIRQTQTVFHGVLERR